MSKLKKREFGIWNLGFGLRCVVAAIVLQSCGAKDNSGDQQKVTFAEDQYAKEHPATRKAGPNAVIVTIADMKFQPVDITIQRGDTVVFNNKDIVTHDITEEKAKAWKSGPLEANASWRFVPTESGNYYCSLHPVMKGSITIR